MSEPILLLNRRPRKHRRRARAKYRHKTNRRRMPAGLRRYWATHRKNPRVRHKYRHRSRRRYHHKVNRRRPSRRVRYYHRKHRTNPRRFRRNRAIRAHAMRGLTHWVGPVVTGAAGGLVLDMAWGGVSQMVSLPAGLSSGWGAFAAKMALLAGGAYALTRVFKGAGARIMIKRGVLGAATVLTYGAARGTLSSMFPSLPGLHGYMDFHSYALPGMHGYMPRAGSALLGSLEDIYSPAAVIQPPGTPVPRQFGGYIARQPGMGAYQPHMVGGGLMGYDWTNDGM